MSLCTSVWVLNNTKQRLFKYRYDARPQVQGMVSETMNRPWYQLKADNVTKGR